jgi:DNA mismatch repair protein MutS
MGSKAMPDRTRRRVGAAAAIAALMILLPSRGTPTDVVAGMDNRTAQKVVDFSRVRLPARSAGPGSHGPRPARAYYSILFLHSDDRAADDGVEAPHFFRDLNCDQIVDAITAGREEYNLKPFFYAPLRRVDAINYRHEVMQDLENPALLERVRSFAQQMRTMRDYLVRQQKLSYKEQKEAWFLDAIGVYCDAINAFAAGLCDTDLKSRAFLGFRDHMIDYAGSVRFNSLLSKTNKLKADLATVKYCVLIKGDKFTVRNYEDEYDYSKEVDGTFERFKQGAAKDYRVRFSETDDMNHIEAKILEFVANLYPAVFGPLEEYCTMNASYLDDKVAEFDREIQFYLAYFDYMQDLTSAGLQFCYPHVSATNKQLYNYDGFDVALAHKLVKQNTSVICNDFYFKSTERILVVSGPNQGGKTTFARAFGQLQYLASIGWPVPGTRAQLFLFDNLFTHFEKEEKVETLRGKLEDDLLRVHEIIERATPQSIIIMNEIFTSTTIHDETFLSKRVIEQISALDVLCVWVTFVDELASYGPQTVSMVSTVVPDNPAVRTFKIVRQAADGLAYAMAIAQKYRLTYDAITERIQS